MILLSSAAVASLFGAGIALLLRRSLVAMIVGASLVSNAAFVFLVAAGGHLGHAPIAPVVGDPNDPLGQALALTGLVINLGTTAVLVALVNGVWATDRTLDLDDVARAARREDDAREDPA